VTAIGCAAAPRSGAPAFRTEQTVVPATPPPPPVVESSGVAEAPAGTTTTPASGEADASKSATSKPATAAPASKSTEAAKEAPLPTTAPRSATAAPASVESEVVIAGSGGSGTSAAPVPPTVPGPPSIQIAAAQANFDEANRQLGVAGSDCAKLCKALASMQRATERLCGLVAAGSDADKRRCTDARTKLTAATAKVNAACGACGS
jgi:hypothetical protein